MTATTPTAAQALAAFDVLIETQTSRIADLDHRQEILGTQASAIAAYLEGKLSAEERNHAEEIAASINVRRQEVHNSKRLEEAVKVGLDYQRADVRDDAEIAEDAPTR